MKKECNLMDIQYASFMAGFDLAGKRLPNGKLLSYLDDVTLLDRWPETVRFGNNNYTLEKVVIGVNGYESALYV